MNAADPGTLTWLRDRNDRFALRLLLEHGPISRARLGELSGMSKPSAAKMIARLETVGIVEPVGEAPGARGPNAVLFGVRPTAMMGVAVSMLADVIEAVVTDPVGTEYPVVCIPTSEIPRSPEGDMELAIVRACAAAGVDRSSVSVLVVGVQAAVDDASDGLEFTNTLPGWPEIGARARIEEATGMTAILDNDVNLATIAERFSGGVDDAPSFSYLWFGDGLGAGLDVEGTIQRGNGGGAGEIGYLELPLSAAALAPGAVDFTDLLGRRAVVSLLGAAPDTPLEEALPASFEGHPALEALAARVAMLAGPVVAIVDPGLVILGGPTGIAGGAALARRVEELVASVASPTRDLSHSLPRTRFRTACVVSRPVLTGAGHLLVEHIWTKLDETITPDRSTVTAGSASGASSRT